MDNNRLLKNFIGLDGFIWWQGVVEDRKDPLKIGRARVRIFGWHTEDKTKMPTENLPWALTMMPVDNGNNPVGLKEGDWVMGFFKDSVIAQEPVIFGVVPGIPTRAADPEIGFSDPTDINTLTSGEVPRPPEFKDDANISASIVTGIQNASRDSLDQFMDELIYQAPADKKLDIVKFKQQLPKLSSASVMNLCQSFLNRSFDIRSIVETTGVEGITNDLGVNSFAALSSESREIFQSGLQTIGSLISSRTDLVSSFTNILQTNTESRLFSLVENNLPDTIKDQLSTLGAGNPMNQIINALDLGQGFSVTQLFSGDITQTVNGLIQTLLPIGSPLDLINAIGVDAATEIAEFLGLGFGSLDQEWTELDEEEEQITDPFKNPDKLPIQGTLTGVLSKDFDANNFIYDIDRNSSYNDVDAQLIILQNTYDGIVDTGGAPTQAPVYPISRYPLEPFLNEPITPREARNELTLQSSVGYKLNDLSIFPTASYAGQTLQLTAPTLKDAEGALKDQDSQESEPFAEPPSPYNAIYPYNHVYKSESGHVIEIDDTPKAERLHWYHRSGTFREIHPDGTLVDKVKNKMYTISNSNMFIGSDENISVTSFLATRIKATTELIFESAATMFTTGAYSVKCGTKMESVTGGVAQSISDNKQVTIGGDYTIKVGGKLNIVASSISLDALSHISIRSPGLIVCEAPVIGNNTEAFNVSGVANLVPTFQSLGTPNLELPLEEPEEAPAAPSTLPPGFILQFLDGGYDAPKSGYLYKPVSDSNGKPVVLTPSTSGSCAMYEALPTGELEETEIKYLNEDGSITTWKTTRPVHKKGKLIESGVYSGLANPDASGDRAHWRFSRFAKDYPKQFIVDDGQKPFFVYDARIRHD